MMDEYNVDGDMFSSMEGELISNIKRPSLLSLSSEDSVDDKMLQNKLVPCYAKSNVKTSTPIKYNNVKTHECEKNDEYTENCDFKMPSMFPCSRSSKRYSMSVFNEISEAYNINKSSSMHDVSSISSFSPLRRDSCMFSTDTLQSNSIATTKSKDSGFQRSTSCTSLTTNSSKKYDHVQSKVKQYIQTIKETEALRKMQKHLEKNLQETSKESVSADLANVSPISECNSISKKELLNKVKELEEELKEKDCVIEQLEKNQSELRLKYAAAENQIDDLRIRASVHNDPMKNYISDEKVAQLLTNNAKITRKYAENGGAKQMLDNLRHEDLSFIRPTGSNNGLKPIKKFCSNSVRMNEEYPVLKTEGILKSSSCKYIREGHYELSKSSSNIDRTSVKFENNSITNLPYEKNSFAKVQHWQRSLVNLNKTNEDAMHMCHTEDGFTNDEVSYCAQDDSTEENRCKSRRYQKNKDADKKRYRKSYPVGCKCEKFKCKSKEEINSIQPNVHNKLHRSVSFANYEDSLTSSIYDDGDSSSDFSEVSVPKHETYKDYKLRKLQQKFKKYGHDSSPSWNEIKKAKSANNISEREGVITPSRNKRLIDNVYTSYKYSCSDRKHCSKRHNKTKYRKLDDCSKVASAECNALVKCKSDHFCGSRPNYDFDKKEPVCLSHSKSFDTYGRRYDVKNTGHRLNKFECSCLTALENLKIQEHNTLAKYVEHVRKHPLKFKEKEALQTAYKRYSFQN